MRRFPTLPLVDLTWRLHQNLSTYDACYVALADILGCVLISAAARFSRAQGRPHPDIPVVDQVSV